MFCKKEVITCILKHYTYETKIGEKLLLLSFYERTFIYPRQKVYDPTRKAASLQFQS